MSLTYLSNFLYLFSLPPKNIQLPFLMSANIDKKLIKIILSQSIWWKSRKADVTVVIQVNFWHFRFLPIV